MYPLFYINLLSSIKIETTIAKIKEHCKTCRRVWKKIFCFLQTLSNRATQKKKEGGTIGNKALLVYFPTMEKFDQVIYRRNKIFN